MKKLYERNIKNFFGPDRTSHIPNTLSVELTNACNLRCPMCPNPYMKRKRGMMDIKIYKDILDEAVELGVKQVGLFATGESLLHPRVGDFVALTKRKRVYTYITANGAKMGPGLHEDLIDAGLDSMKFSIDAHNQEIYSKVRPGGHIETVFENLRKMDRLRKEKKSNMQLHVLYTISGENEQYVEDFKKIVGPYVDDIQYFASLSISQGAGKEVTTSLRSERVAAIIEKHRKKSVCPNPWNRLSISWEGYLMACCLDFELDLAYAKYEKGRLKEHWNNSGINDIRESLLNHDQTKYLVCAKCDATNYDLPALSKEIDELYR